MSLLQQMQMAQAGGGVGDPYWADVVALLHFDVDYTDVTGKIWTSASGSPPPGQITAAQSKFGGKSINFNGTGGWSITTPNSADLAFPGDFTIEGWVWQDPAYTSTYRTLFIGDSMGCISVSIKDGKISAGANSVADDVTGATTIPTSAWNHIAITRSGSSLKVFLNGNVDGAVTNTRNYTQGSATFRIGASASGTAFGGYVDDLRVTKGVARYTANFIPPTAPFPNHA